MTKATGRLASFGLGKEAVRGTAETSADAFIRHTDLTAGEVVDKIVDDASVGVIAGSVGEEVAVSRAEFTVSTKMGRETGGHYLLAALGTDTVTANPDSTYTHDFTVLESSQHPSYTLFKDDHAQGYTYANGVLSNIEFIAQNGNYMNVNTEWTAKIGQTATITTAYPTESVFRPRDINVKIANDVAGLGAASAICVRNMRVTIDKGLITDQCLGSIDYSDILNGTLMVEGEFEIAYEDATYRDLTINNNYRAVRLEATNASEVIGSGSQNPYFRIDLDRVTFNAQAVNYDNANLASIVVQFKAHYDVSAASMIAAQLINTTASY